MDYGESIKPEVIDGFDPAYKTKAGELVQTMEDESPAETDVARLKKLGDTASTNLTRENETPSLGEITPETPPTPKELQNSQTTETAEAPLPEQNIAINSNDPVVIAKELEAKISNGTNPADFYEAFQKTRDAFEGEQKNG